MATKYLVIQGTANSSEEAITLCGEALHKAGIVGEDFGKACVEREKIIQQDFQQKSQQQFHMQK